jgi:uncharacterized protein (DUF934 family)
VQIIKDQVIVEDSWKRLVEITPEENMPTGDVIIPYDYWLEHKDALIKREGKLGVCISGDDDTLKVARDIEHFDLIALDFPVFTDGRSYSHACLLRERYNFKGELRAVGNVLRDQLYFMHRCGINSFHLGEGKDLEDALNAFTELSVKYQTAADGAEPVYKYR